MTAGAGQPIAHRGVGEHGERVVDEHLRIGPALVARRGLLGPPYRRQRLDQRVDGHGVEPAHDRPPAGVRRAGLAHQRGQHPAAGGEIIGQLGERAQVRHRGAVAGLLGGIGQLGRVDGQRGHRPRAAARGRPGARRAGRVRTSSGEATGPPGARGQQQRERDGLAGVQRR